MRCKRPHFLEPVEVEIRPLFRLTAAILMMYEIILADMQAKFIGQKIFDLRPLS